MSGTCGNVVSNVGARKQIVNGELGGHDGRFARETSLLAWAGRPQQAQHTLHKSRLHVGSQESWTWGRMWRLRNTESRHQNTSKMQNEYISS